MGGGAAFVGELLLGEGVRSTELEVESLSDFKVSTGSLSTEICLGESIRSNELEEVESLCNKGLVLKVSIVSLSTTRNKGRLLRI